jgi:hypothetical protein
MSAAPFASPYTSPYTSPTAAPAYVSPTLLATPTVSPTKSIFHDAKANSAIMAKIFEIFGNHVYIEESEKENIARELAEHLPAIIVGYLPETVTKLLKDSHAPKQAPSGYLVFCNQHRDYFKNELLKANGDKTYSATDCLKAYLDDNKKEYNPRVIPPKMATQYVMMYLGYAWRSMSDEKKKPYLDEANASKANRLETLQTYQRPSIAQLLADPINNKKTRARSTSTKTAKPKDPDAPKQPKAGHLILYDLVKGVTPISAYNLGPESFSQGELAKIKAFVEAHEGTQRVSAIASIFKLGQDATKIAPQGIHTISRPWLSALATAIIASRETLTAEYKMKVFEYTKASMEAKNNYVPEDDDPFDEPVMPKFVTPAGDEIKTKKHVPHASPQDADDFFEEEIQDNLETVPVNDITAEYDDFTFDTSVPVPPPETPTPSATEKNKALADKLRNARKKAGAKIQDQE